MLISDIQGIEGDALNEVLDDIIDTIVLAVDASKSMAVNPQEDACLVSTHQRSHLLILRLGAILLLYMTLNNLISFLR